MPEAPDLEVIKDFLIDKAVGTCITEANVIKPSVLRSLNGDFASGIDGCKIEGVQRRGKFLLLHLSEQNALVINPMLTGALQYCAPKTRVFKRTCFTLSLSNGNELRYIDERQMGIVYFVSEEQLDQVPRLNEQGPDVLDCFSFDDFKEKLRRFHGEIKGVLTRGQVISGIGNAYSDEILFAAQVYPFRKRKSLTPDELERIYRKSREVIENAILILRERMGADIHVKIRDFLSVHNKGGTACPRCGNNISQLTANRRITSYCRKCQPGMLIRN